mgnify:CR=1 FL=1
MKRDRQQQEILGEAVRNAFLKLDPRIQWKNPVMFIVFLGAILVAVLAVRAFMAGNTQEGWFDLHIDLCCGLRFCLPILPKLLPKHVVKHRPTACVRLVKRQPAKKVEGNKIVTVSSSQVRRKEIVICL